NPASLATAWKECAELYDQSRDVCREFLEILGGLTIRQKALDQGICQMADELIRSSAKDTESWNSMTIPAPQEALGKTLARLVGLRFPEWSIWTLPVAAHEFGHVVVGDSAELNKFADKQTETDLKADSALQEALPAEPDDAARERHLRGPQKRVRSKVNELLADAFATYTMGPAYAFSVVLLRFNPSTALDSDGGQPSEAERALVIFEMLRRMDASVGEPPPFKDLIEKLETEWSAMLRRAAATGTEPDRSRVKELVDGIWKTFSIALLPGAQYSAREEREGWLTSRSWWSKWQQSWHDRGEFVNPEITDTSKLRDVLNAAWLYRFYVQPKDAAEVKLVEARQRLLEKAARELCTRIIDEKLRYQAQLAQEAAGLKGSRVTQRATSRS